MVNERHFAILTIMMRDRVKELMLEPTVCLQALNDRIIYPDEAKLKKPEVGKSKSL